MAQLGQRGQELFPTNSNQNPNQNQNHVQSQLSQFSNVHREHGSDPDHGIDQWSDSDSDPPINLGQGSHQDPQDPHAPDGEEGRQSLSQLLEALTAEEPPPP